MLSNKMPDDPYNALVSVTLDFCRFFRVIISLRLQKRRDNNQGKEKMNENDFILEIKIKKTILFTYDKLKI